MSYEPTKWQTGDIITLNKLNKLEQGVAAMMEEYEPTVWQIGDTVTSTKLNKLEQAVAILSESGGGTTLGELQSVPAYHVGMPSIGDNVEDYVTLDVYDLYVGQNLACSGCSAIESIASGITVKRLFSLFQVRGAYVVMYQTGTTTVTDVTPFADYSFADKELSFTMPDLPTREETGGKDCLLVFDVK